MQLKKGFKQLVAEASARVSTVSLEDARGLVGNPDVLFVDVRDVRELEREGMIPGAFHAPRGMLEFWVDPESPYYKDIFGSGRHFVLYCGSAWRSSLAAAVLGDMGLPRVSHLADGFAAWKKAGAPVVPRPQKG